MKKVRSAIALCGFISVFVLAGCGSATPQSVVPVATAADVPISAAAKNAQPEILVTNYDGYTPSTAVIFAKGAHGNAPPFRSFATKVRVFGIRPDGSYWSGPMYATKGTAASYVERHAANGKVINKIAGSAYEPLTEASTNRNGDLLAVGWQRYESGAGCVTLAGTVRLFSAANSFKQSRAITGEEYCIDAAYADPNGDVYLGYNNDDFYTISDDYAEIDEIGPYAKKVYPATRQIQLSYPYDTIQGLMTDTHGNLFALENGELLKYAPGETLATYALRGVPVSSFTLDSKNDLYVIVGTYIEEFAPGKSRPMRVIGGPATGLTNPSGITVSD